jgi:inner membrane protease subunit 2
VEAYTKTRERNAYLVSVSSVEQSLHCNTNMNDRSPMHPEKLAIKRVIALEGDMVYTRAPCPVPTVFIPVNHVWVEGDNRDKSLDSNSYGPIPMSLIQGKITHVLLPWKSAGAIDWRRFKGKTRVIRGRRQDAPNWN